LTSDLSGYLPLTGGTLTGALSGTSATFSGNVVLSGSDSRFNGGDSVGRLIMSNSNTTTYIGLYGATHPTLPYVMSFVVNSASALSIASTGAATFSSSVTASSLLSNTWVGAQGIRFSSAPTIQGVYLGNSGTSSTDYATIEMVGGTSGGCEIDFTKPGLDVRGRVGYDLTSDYMWFTTGGATERMRIFSGGNVFIGSSATDGGYKLDVNGTGRFGGMLSVMGWLSIYSDATNMGAIGFNRNAANGVIYNSSYGAYQVQNETGSFLITAFNSSGVSQGNRLTIASTGAATFSSSVTATGFFESSSVVGKDIIKTNPLTNLNIDVIKYTRKADENKDVRYGYSAEQIHSLMPELTDKDVTAVKYLDVHTLLIAQLQQEIKELKAKLN
jgi:hypothetical protein